MAKTEWDYKTETDPGWLKNEANRASYVLKRKWTEIAFVVIFCAIVFVFGHYKYIQGETVAAILGAVLGFCIEQWKHKD